MNDRDFTTKEFSEAFFEAINEFLSDWQVEHLDNYSEVELLGVLESMKFQVMYSAFDETGERAGYSRLDDDEELF